MGGGGEHNFISENDDGPPLKQATADCEERVAFKSAEDKRVFMRRVSRPVGSTVSN